MTRIKICGITNAEDARAAWEMGADALGFIFVPSSPRYVGRDPTSARALIEGVPPLVGTVGVFDAFPVDEPLLPLLQAVQYYRRPPGSPVLGARTLPIKAFRVKDEESLTEIAADRDPKALILLDAYSPNALGGTGHTFNWELAVRAKEIGRPLVLAGGLTPENVGDAVRAVRPFMVDVSSGVEAEPGRKDWDKMRRFIHAVREADREADAAAAERP